jgi:hypothetical protein
MFSYFPTADRPPTVKISGDAAIIGKQRVTLVDNHLVLAEKGK